MFRARKMLKNEFPSLEAFAERDATGAPRHFCVEAENGRITPCLSWREAVAEAEQLNRELVTLLIAA